MIDAVKLLKEAQRMCMETEYCEGCPIHEYCAIDTNAFEIQEPEKVVEIVEKWSTKHPKKTRQSEFLKMFPNVPMENGFLLTNPCWVDSTVKCLKQKSDGVYEDAPERCIECREEYWNQEVE